MWSSSSAGPFDTSARWFAEHKKNTGLIHRASPQCWTRRVFRSHICYNTPNQPSTDKRKQRFCSLEGSQAVNKSAQSEDCSASERALTSVEAGESPVSWTSHIGRAPSPGSGQGVCSLGIWTALSPVPVQQRSLFCEAVSRLRLVPVPLQLPSNPRICAQV